MQAERDVIGTKESSEVQFVEGRKTALWGSRWSL